MQDDLRDTWRMIPSGDRCLIIAFSSDVIADANKMARAVAERLLEAKLVGVSDIVPSMTAVGVHYDPAKISTAPEAPVPFDSLMAVIERLMGDDPVQSDVPGRKIAIPVCYGGEYGPDLEEVAAFCGLSTNEIVALHTGQPADVFMLGFAPGHPYIGTFDQRLALPRRSTPRTAVPQGSIGLANRQSVIYPMTMPGGWSIIGRTPLKLFDPYRASPCLLNAGDQVRFIAITEVHFEQLRTEEDTK